MASASEAIHRTTKPNAGLLRRSRSSQCQAQTARHRTIMVDDAQIFGALPVMGSWKIDQTTGKTEFCISDAARCVKVTPPS
jgi:hypothetical protein